MKAAPSFFLLSLGILFFLTSWKRGVLALSLAFLGYVSMPLDESVDENLSKKGIFTPDAVEEFSSHFKRGWILQGHYYDGEKSFPCSLSLGKRPKCARMLIEGFLKKSGPYHFRIKPIKITPLQKSSLPEIRFQIKESIRSFIKKRIPSKRASQFLSALLLGENSSKELRFSFQTLGLSHILAISGFHFALIACFLTFFFRLFLSLRLSQVLVLIFLTAYFFLLGYSPSLFRAYIFLSFYFLAELLGKKISILNILGLAALFEMIHSPLVLFDIGFQLSFVSCFSLLFFYRFFDSLWKKLFLEKNPETLQFSALHGFIVSKFLKKILSTLFSVNLLLIPLLLYHFHTFPLVSFLYNLFIPLLTGISLFLFLGFLPLFFWEAPFRFLSHLIDFELNLTSFPPPLLQRSLRVSSLGIDAVLIYLTLFFFLGILILSLEKGSSDRV